MRTRAGTRVSTAVAAASMATRKSMSPVPSGVDAMLARGMSAVMVVYTVTGMYAVRAMSAMTNMSAATAAIMARCEIMAGCETTSTTTATCSRVAGSTSNGIIHLEILVLCCCMYLDRQVGR